MEDTNIDEELFEALLTTAPKGELLTDQQVYDWVQIKKGTSASQRHAKAGIIFDCTIWLGPRSPRTVKKKLAAKLAAIVGKGRAA